jgi:uncharacterized protein with PQ loop repeat
MDLMLLWLSILAAVCSTTASLPQLLKKETKSISHISLGLRFTGAVLWTIYGLLREEYVLMACSATAGIIETLLLCKTCRSSPNDTLSSPTDDADS